MCLIKKTVCLLLWGCCIWQHAQCSLPPFQSLIPETNLSLTLIKVKIVQFLDKMPWGELKVILQLVTTCLLPRFYCFHVYFLPLDASPTQLLSCYLLTQSSLLHLMTSFPGLLLVFLHILLCMYVSPYIPEIFSKKWKPQLSQLPDTVSFTSLYFLL